MATTTISGGLLAVASSLQFPSVAEKLAWTLPSIYMTTFPLLNWALLRFGSNNDFLIFPAMLSFPFKNRRVRASFPSKI
ncbi:hypothetical protein DL98DRAFT_513457 [Cadophora sp. DSE1049]|nr:hypothetical protein DL98DRAFT_513457 [Cadophora sp. DSE1049]